MCGIHQLYKTRPTERVDDFNFHSLQKIFRKMILDKLIEGSLADISPSFDSRKYTRHYIGYNIRYLMTTGGLAQFLEI